MNLEQLIQYIEDEYPHWNWLVRRDHPYNPYFANIFDSRTHQKFPCYADSAKEALGKSLSMLEDHLAKVVPERRIK